MMATNTFNVVVKDPGNSFLWQAGDTGVASGPDENGQYTVYSENPEDDWNPATLTAEQLNFAA